MVGTLLIVHLFLQLTVSAADLRGLGPPGTVRTITGIVRVVVLDINDNVPTFIDPVSCDHLIGLIETLRMLLVLFNGSIIYLLSVINSTNPPALRVHYT